MAIWQEKRNVMNVKNWLNLMMLVAALMFAATGCKHKSLMTPLPNSGTKGGGDSAITPAPPVNPGGDVGSSTTGIPLGQGHPGWQEDPSMPLKAQTIYFDYDKEAIKTSEQSKLEEVANYMKSHAEAALRVEGNCDERGTEEYNRALGERRALAAREYLVRLGIDAGRVDTISYGEDKPVDPGHTEAAWSKNRRDDFTVLLPPKP